MNAKILTLIFSLSYCSLAWSDLLIIVNTKNPVNTLERKQVVDLFMGRVSAFPNQEPAHVLDIKESNSLRGLFYKSLTGKSEAQVDAYWATLMFAGRMSPPEKVQNEAAILNEVKQNPAAIGYVTKQTLPAGVKIVMELHTVDEEHKN